MLLAGSLFSMFLGFWTYFFSLKSLPVRPSDFQIRMLSCTVNSETANWTEVQYQCNGFIMLNKANTTLNKLNWLPGWDNITTMI